MTIKIRNGKVVFPKNAKQIPKVYYGLHMAEGVAEYEENGQPSRIFISNEVINKMSPTFEGKPVFVEHQDTDMDRLQEQADGYVINSFFNKADGRHWVKFIVVSDRGHQAIQNGWTLSNCYEIDSSGNGGRWHNVEFDQEVTGGEFDHLAIVQNPRYEESVILTPEEFRTHNAKKESELSVLYNSKRKGKPVGFKLWKKEKVENAADMEGVIVELDDGTETTISDMISAVKLANEKKKSEAEAAKKKKKNEVSKDEKVKVGDTEMTVGELISAYQTLVKKHTTSEDDSTAENESDDSDDSESEDEKRKRREREKMESAKNEEDTAENASDDDDDDEDRRKEKKSDKKANEKREKIERAEKLRNAGPDKSKVEPVYVDTALDQVERGRARYGSASSTEE